MHWTRLEVNILEVAIEISSFGCYVVKLNSNFGFSLSIQTSLTDDLNRGEFKLIRPKLPFLCCRGNELKKSRLSLSIVKLVFNIKVSPTRLEQQAH